ncbi:hypothetical protein ACFL3T_02715 [Patescibacteria group bacterium]
MPAKQLKDKFLKLALPQKIVGIGALIALISAILPWYSDIDMYNTGERFLGVTGPLYLVGYIIIALSIFSIILTGFYLLNKKIPTLPMKESMVYILSGVVSLSLLIIANSVYFHPEFGVNITSKEYGIGMMLALIGSVAILIGGILQQRESGTSRFVKEFQEETGVLEEETIDPVLELNNFQKEQMQREQKLEEINKSEFEPEPEPKKTTAEERFEGHKGVREYKAKSEFKASPTSSKVRQEPYPDPSLLKKEASHSPAEISKEEGVNPNTVIRMDL